MKDNYEVMVKELKEKHLLKGYKDNGAMLDNYTDDLFILLRDILKDFVESQEEAHRDFFKNLNITSSMDTDCFVFLCDEKLTFVEGCSSGAVTYDEICGFDGRMYPPNKSLSVEDILNSSDDEFDLTLIDKNGEHKTYGRLNKESLYKICHDLVIDGEEPRNIAIFNLKDSMSLHKYADIHSL